jgi:hypothetical protein
MKVLRWSRLLSKTAVLIFVCGATYACDEFLDAPPQGALDEGTLANQDGVEGLLLAAYRGLDWNGASGFEWSHSASNWAFGSIPSDDAHKGSTAGDQLGAQDIQNYNWSTGEADDYLNGRWQALYDGVVRANAVITLLNKVVDADPDEISDADREGIRGEALVLRAHYHFELWKMWENIAYYTELDTDTRKSNEGVDVAGSLISDLDEAAGLLPATQRYGDVGRVTSNTALAYKGMVQVYAGDYAGALTTLRPFTTNGVYALESDFSKVWTGFPAFSNGLETILAYQASANDGAPDGNNANYGERLNFPNGGPFGCCGFHQPTQNLVNYFRVDANGLPLALSDPAGWNNVDTEWDAAASGAVAFDPRVDWTVGRDDVPYKDWEVHQAGWIRDVAHAGPYSPKKTAYESGSGAVSNVGWVNTQLSSMNIHIYRYADLLLLLAEAEVEAGDLENARAIVNQIRTRAAVAAQGPVGGPLAVPIDDPSITWANYQVGQYTTPWTDPAAARAAVQAERRLELAMEGKRFFDLRRWGIAETVLNNFLGTETAAAGRGSATSGAQAFASKHLLYPIPSLQIELSKVADESGNLVDRLVQNPGWAVAP